MKVKDLKPRMEVPEIDLEIVSVGDERQFASEKGTGKLIKCAAKDKSGEVSLTLWNEQTSQIKEGDKIKIENGWCSEWQGQLQLSTGRKGTLTVL